MRHRWDAELYSVAGDLLCRPGKHTPLLCEGRKKVKATKRSWAHNFPSMPVVDQENHPGRSLAAHAAILEATDEAIRPQAWRHEFTRSAVARSACLFGVYCDMQHTEGALRIDVLLPLGVGYRRRS